MTSRDVVLTVYRFISPSPRVARLTLPTLPSQGAFYAETHSSFSIDGGVFLGAMDTIMDGARDGDRLVFDLYFFPKGVSFPAMSFQCVIDEDPDKDGNLGAGTWTRPSIEDEAGGDDIDTGPFKLTYADLLAQ